MSDEQKDLKHTPEDIVAASRKLIEGAAAKLAEDMTAVQIHLEPKHRDVHIGRNPLGYGEAWYVWSRYVLAVLPTATVGRLYQLILILRDGVQALLYSIFGALLVVINSVLKPLMHTLAAMFGCLEIRYTKETVVRALLDAVFALDSYKEFVAAGGKFDKDAIVLTDGFMRRVEEAIVATSGKANS